MISQVFVDEHPETLRAISRVGLESWHRDIIGDLIHVAKLRIVVYEEMNVRWNHLETFILDDRSSGTEFGAVEECGWSDVKCRSRGDFRNEAVSPVDVHGSVEDREEPPAVPKERPG